MSSNADFDLIEENRRYDSDLKPRPQDEPDPVLLTELMGDMRDEEAEYATFEDDKPGLSVRQRVLYGALLLAIIFAAGWAVHRAIFDGLPALLGDRPTHQVEQPSTPAQVPNPQDWEKAIEEAIGGYSASIVPPPAGNAPTPTRNGSTSGDVIIPFGALPKLIEIDTSSMSDGAAGHMEELKPIRAW